MESFNSENIIYIKEEDCIKDRNVKEEVDYKDYEDEKIPKMDYMKSQVKQDIIIKIESITGDKDDDDDFMGQADNKMSDLKEKVNDDDVTIKEEGLNFKEYNGDSTSIEDPLDENNPSSFKSENISRIENYTEKLKYSDNIVDFRDGTTQQESVYTNCNPYECCESSSSSSQSSERNVNINSKLQIIKLYQCTECNFSTFHIFQIISHIKSHEVLSLFESDQASISKSSLKDVNKIDCVNENSTQNNNCNSTTKRARLQIHTTEPEKEPFKCDFCDYCSSNISHLRDHIRLHTGEKPFKCNHCDYRSARKSSLRSHTRIHTGEKPFKCNHCDYAAAQKPALQDHIRIHTGEKPFKCDLCDYTASFKSNIRTHKRIHTGEKPFKCNNCGYAVSHKSSLKNHVKLHSSEKPLKCDFCGFIASNKANLSRHIKSHIK